MNRDKHGIIGQIQPAYSVIEVEGGDSATWMGHWLYLNNGTDPGGIRVKNTEDYVKFFEKGFCGYVRHPDPEMTYNGFGAYYDGPYKGCMSRDQLTGVLAALIKGGHHKAMLRVILNHATRGFLFTYNTIHNGRDPKNYKFNLIKFFRNPNKDPYFKLPDLTMFKTWAMMLRGFGKLSWIFWPLLCILDLQMIIDTLIGNKEEEDDTINYAGRLFTSRDYVPTPTSWLALRILDREKLLGDLRHYFCRWRDNCEFLPLYEEKIRNLK